MGFLAAVSGDAFQLPFADSSIDCVGCSLFAHHLEPEQITQFANEALRVATTKAIDPDASGPRLAS